jgi:tRNA (Thr-GGU) A37 N-methylase
VTLLRGDGRGGFRAQPPILAGPAPFSVQIAALNRDGKPDLAVHNYSGQITDPRDDALTFLLGDGKGGFRLGPRLATGPGPLDVAVGDVDGDGFADAVTADFGGSDLTVYFGGADGLASRTICPIGAGRAACPRRRHGDGGRRRHAGEEDRDVAVFLSMRDRRLAIEPIGSVRGRNAMTEDGWGSVRAAIELDAERFTPDAVAGLDAFSHVVVVYQFHRVTERQIEQAARQPGERAGWPNVGIFAQRGKARPNRIGVSVCRILRVDEPGSRSRASTRSTASGPGSETVHARLRAARRVREPDWAGNLRDLPVGGKRRAPPGGGRRLLRRPCVRMGAWLMRVTAASGANAALRI